MSNWKAMAGRITLIPTAPGFSTDVLAHRLYDQVWGQAPEGFQNPSNPLTPSVAQGRRGNLTVACSVQRNRIDFNLSPGPMPDAQFQPLQVALIEDNSELLTEYKHVIDAMQKMALPNIGRVALYSQFSIPGKRFSDVNRLLPKVIPTHYGFRDIDGEDFILQINKPQKSKVINNLRLNVATKWSVDHLRVIRFHIQSDSGQPQTEQSELLAASVSFDLSSAQRDVPLTLNEQSGLLHELLFSVRQSQKSIGLGLEGFDND